MKARIRTIDCTEYVGNTRIRSGFVYIKNAIQKELQFVQCEQKKLNVFIKLLNIISLTKPRIRHEWKWKIISKHAYIILPSHKIEWIEEVKP